MDAAANLAPKKPILSRDPSELPETLNLGTDLPDDLDPLADGILMEHQKTWLEDKSDLKIAEKGRRTGITFAEALDSAITAASKKSAGGDNVFYVGDTKEKGREFIGYVAHFAKAVAGELIEIDEYLFEDKQPDGTTKHITAYRARFNSGFRVEALSSNPANIRGLQGIVVIDEAAFHKDVREVIDAVNAMLIWGGKVRIISTHNGVLNPFNELIREARAKKTPYEVHHIPFGDAVKNGLYRRVCLMRGKDWSQEDQDAWEAQIRGSYGSRTAAMKQELDAIPAEAEGAALTRVQIEACTKQGIPFHRWIQPDEFKNASDEIRKAEALAWCEKHLKPALEKLNQNGKHVMGEDFARSGDATDIVIQEVTETLVRETKLLVELRNIPFDQQRDILFYICDRVPNFIKGALDKTGNGAYLAEKATQRYGERIVEVAFSREWYSREMPPYIEAFGDKTIVLCAHADVVQDHQSLQFVDGIIKVPDGFRMKGSDGLDRHGDSAVASALAFFASRQDYFETDYRGLPRGQEYDNPEDHALGQPEGSGRNWWDTPLGADLKGGIL
ncbi:terminase large subunit domain-containing protein [Phaeobacter sp. 11ANDIMAR09]|uniref:terminase large subunit domain-containing protein n=1 Tax=Phaeobacter sp. 11ANDIMAR09 TaxID=1225647 RepID=UPI000AF4E0FB|nr:terminase family protein [Phaeobacter sp. 11ANDIMAR09]